jgi:hypothetical protein
LVNQHRPPGYIWSVYTTLEATNRAAQITGSMVVGDHREPIAAETGAAESRGEPAKDGSPAGTDIAVT